MLTLWLSSKFVIKPLLKLPPRLKRVAALFCKIFSNFFLTKCGQWPPFASSYISCPVHAIAVALQVQSSHHPALCNYPLLTRNITMVVFHTTNTEIISQHNSHWTHKNVSVNSSSDQMDPTKLSCLQVTDRQLSNQYFNKKLDSMR